MDTNIHKHTVYILIKRKREKKKERKKICRDEILSRTINLN